MSMVKKCYKFILVMLAALLCGCSARSEVREGNGLLIVASDFPAYDFARELACEDAQIVLLVPPGSETHSYEPTPQDMLTLQNADLIICNGGESESWMEEITQALDGKPVILRMLDCVEALEEETVEGMQDTHEEESDEPEFDEHVWTSPVKAQEICGAITEKLCEIDAEHAEIYAEHAEQYIAQLQALDAQFRDVTENADRKLLIFADRFPVRYFTEEYGLTYFAAFPGCADDAEPSARTVAFLIDKVRDESVPAVFYIEMSNRKMADVICEDTGCKQLLFHSCHNVTKDELQSGACYLSLMQENLNHLKEALN